MPLALPAALLLLLAPLSEATAAVVRLTGAPGCGVAYLSAPADARVAVGASAPASEDAAWSSISGDRLLLDDISPTDAAWLELTEDNATSVTAVQVLDATHLVDQSLDFSASSCAGAWSRTLQEGIDAVPPSGGAVVLAAPDTYRGAGNCGVKFSGKAVRLGGALGAESTSIDCENVGSASSGASGVVFEDGEGVDSILEDFTVTRVASGSSGAAVLVTPSSTSGLASSPTIRRCVVEESTSTGRGGGLLIERGAALVQNCTVRDNKATGGGGGLFLDVPEGVRLEGTLVTLNTASSASTRGGGGVLVEGGEADFVRCELRANACESPHADGAAGGGLHVLHGSVSLTQSTLATNVASGAGGAVFLEASAQLSARDTTFRQNQARTGGGLGLWACVNDFRDRDACESYALHTSATPAARATLAGGEVRGNEATTGGGGGLMLWGGVSVVASEGVVIEANRAPYAEGGGVHLRPVDDAVGQPPPTLTLDGATVRSNEAAAGGGVFVREARLNVMANATGGGGGPAGGGGGPAGVTLFEANRAQLLPSSALSPCVGVEEGSGGGLYLLRSLAHIANGTRIVANEAAQSGGGLFAVGSDEARGASEAPALGLVGLTPALTLDDVWLGSNLGTHGAGAALDGGAPTLSRVTFDANGAPSPPEPGDDVARAGGGLQCWGGARVELRHGVVHANTALLGGGLAAGSSELASAGGAGTGCDLVATSLVCEGNRAQTRAVASSGGGCAFVGGGSSLELLDASVVANSAAGYAGGVLVAGGSLNVSGASDVCANAGALGGAVALVDPFGDGAASPRAVFDGTNVSDNTASSDGGVAYVDAGELRVTAGVLARNAADGGGGVLALALASAEDASAPVTVRVATSVIEANRAAHGAIGFVAAQQVARLAEMVPCAADAGGNTCRDNMASEWGDDYASLPTSLAYVADNGTSAEAADAAAVLGAPLPGHLALLDAYGQHAPMARTELRLSHEADGAAADAADSEEEEEEEEEEEVVDATLLDASGCTSTHCLSGARLLVLGANATLLLDAYSLSGAPGRRLLTATARGDGGGWRANVSVPVELLPCAAGEGASWVAVAGGAAVTALVARDATRACAPCAPGTAKPAAGMGSCAPCAPGNYAPSAGSGVCTPCAAGHAAPSNGSRACVPCAAGESTDGMTGRTNCSLCAPGHSTAPNGGSSVADGANVGQPYCTPCAPGNYQPDQGQPTCRECAGASNGGLAVYSGEGQPRCAVCADGADCEHKDSSLVSPSWWFCESGGGRGGRAGCELLQREAEESNAAGLGAGSGSGSGNVSAGGFAFLGTAEGWWAPNGSLSAASHLDGAARCTPPAGSGSSVGHLLIGDDGEPFCEAASAQVEAAMAAAAAAASGSETGTLSGALSAVAVRFYECEPINGLAIARCLGPANRTSFDSECAPGHTGPICGRCLAGYHREYTWSGAVCVACSNTSEGMARWYDERGLTGPDELLADLPLNYGLHASGWGVAAAIVAFMTLVLLKCTDDKPMDGEEEEEQQQQQQRQQQQQQQQQGEARRQPGKGAKGGSSEKGAAIGSRRREAKEETQQLQACSSAGGLHSTKLDDSFFGGGGGGALGSSGKLGEAFHEFLSGAGATASGGGGGGGAGGAGGAGGHELPPTPPLSPPAAADDDSDEEPEQHEKSVVPSEIKFQDKLEKAGKGTSAAKGARSMRNQLALLPSMGPSGGVLLAHLQIVALLPTLIAVEWPPELLEVAEALRRLVVFDPNLMLDLDCIQTSSYFDRLFSSITNLVVLQLTVPVTCAVITLLARCVRRSGAGPGNRLRRFQARCVALYFIVGFVLYSPVSSTTLRYFRCRDFGDGWYMIADVGVKCYDADGRMMPRYRDWMPLAIFGVVAVVIGMPLFNMALLFKMWRQGRLRQDARGCVWTKTAYGPLFAKYNEANVFWEGVEVFKRLVFTSALVLLEGDLILQCTTGLLLAFVIVITHANRRPYQHKADDRISFAAHVGVFMMMLTALQMQAGHTPTEGAEVSLFLVLSLLPLLVAALMFVWVFCEVGTDEIKQKRAEKAHEKYLKRKAQREAARAEMREEEAERGAAARAHATTAI